MVGQKKISTFFKSVTAQNVSRNTGTGIKRSAEEAKDTDSAPIKKPLIESCYNQQQTQMVFKDSSMDSIGLDTIGKSWRNALNAEFSKDYFSNLSKFVSSERSKYTVYPPVEETFSWTQHSSVNDVKVVILGQDPYHGENQAHGLCFSVKKPVRPPPSLENMFKELKSDIEGFVHPQHGDLTGWAEQGVLLLNAVLSVRARCANSHKDKGWEKFTDAVIRYISSNCKGVVFLLWGSYAQKKGAIIDKSRHHILKSVHPSPLSAYRGFLGCQHFSKANQLLKKQGDKEIDWCNL